MAKLAQNPRIRAPMSAEHRAKLSAAQKAYVQTDPRWEDHRQKLADAVRREETRARLAASMKAYMETDPRWPEHRERMMDAATRVTRLTLLPEEVEQVVEMRRKGRNFEYISETLCVGQGIIRRELKTLGIDVEPVRIGPRVKRGKGFWRSFD
jgi:hypothetical protein